MKFDTKDMKNIFPKHVCIFKSVLFIDKGDEVNKNHLILERKVTRIDFHQLIHTVNINQHDFIE